MGRVLCVFINVILVAALPLVVWGQQLGVATSISEFKTLAVCSWI